MAAGKPQKIMWNGRSWTFTPGENGSLISDDKVNLSRPTLVDNVNRPSVAKAIMSPELQMKRKILSAALVKRAG